MVNLEKELRRQLDEQLAEILDERDKIAYLLYRDGVSKRQIYLNGLHTKAAITGNEAIQHGAQLIGDVVAVVNKGGKARVSPESIQWTKKDAVIRVILSDADYEKTQAEPDMEKTREGTFLVKDGYVEPHTNDMAIPAVWLFYRSMDFQMRLKEFAGVE